jgi:hypothetical protein
VGKNYDKEELLETGWRLPLGFYEFDWFYA